MFKRILPGLLLCAALTACGGGGASTSIPVAQTPASGGGGSAIQNVTISVAVPIAASSAAASNRHVQYVSTATNSIAIAVNGGKPVIGDLSAGSKLCTVSNAVRTCTITVGAPVGTDTFAVSLFASSDGSGAVLSQNTVSSIISAGVANTVKIALQGVVAKIALALDKANPPAGTASTSQLTVTFSDASGQLIVGSDPFANPITLTDSDTSGATTLSKQTLNSPGDAASITVGYNGASNITAVFGATAAGVSSSNVKTATLTSGAPISTSFVDWPTYAFDAQRTGYNPYTTAITPASISNLHIAWQTPIHGSTQSQPIVATNINNHTLLIIANYALAQAYDALTGKQMWSTTLPTQDVQDCGNGPISGTATYDKSLGAVFMAAGTSGGGAPNHVRLYRLDVASGAIQASVDVTPDLVAGEANYSHAGISEANGRVYVGTGSDCEGTATGQYPSWRGRVVSVIPTGSMQVEHTFYTTWGHGGNYGGGGVWSWGGVSSDASGNVFVAAGNAETPDAIAPRTPQPPFIAAENEYVGYGEHEIELTSDLTSVENSNYPGFNFTVGHGDLDYTGVPVVYQPPGCSELTATQGKGGTLVVNKAADLSVVSAFNLAVPSSSANYIGNPAYSPATQYLYAPITSSGAGGSMLPPGLAAIGGCGSNIAWHAQFGPDSTSYGGENPRSAPTVTAGGVVFLGTPCTNDGNGGCGSAGKVNGALWAVDASSGTVLNNTKPLLITADPIRMAPSADGSWIWVLDGSGNFYGLTVDPSIKSVAARQGEHILSRLRVRAR